MTKLIPNSLQQRFFALSKKDQLALTLLAIFLSALLIVYVLIVPADRYADNAAEQRQQRAELLAWMQENASEARRLNKQQTQSNASANQSILSLAAQTAQAHSISFKRFEPFDENGIRIWLDEVNFNHMLRWLGQLQAQYGIQIQQASLDRGQGNGTASAKLELIKL